MAYNYLHHLCSSCKVTDIFTIILSHITLLLWLLLSSLLYLNNLSIYSTQLSIYYQFLYIFQIWLPLVTWCGQEYDGVSTPVGRPRSRRRADGRELAGHGFPEIIQKRRDSAGRRLQGEARLSLSSVSRFRSINALGNWWLWWR